MATSENQYIAAAVTAAVLLSQQLKCIEAMVARTEARVADIANREVALSHQLKGIKRRVSHTYRIHPSLRSPTTSAFR